jgi:hypothetical protein
MRNMTPRPFDVKITYEDGKRFDDCICVVNKTLAMEHAKSNGKKAGFVGKIRKIEVDEGEELCARIVKAKKNASAPVMKPEQCTSEPAVENVDAVEESKSHTDD